MKEVYATNNEVEIQMLVGLLESQGIFAQVHADGAGGYLRVQGADLLCGWEIHFVYNPFVDWYVICQSV